MNLNMTTNERQLLIDVLELRLLGQSMNRKHTEETRTLLGKLKAKPQHMTFKRIDEETYELSNGANDFHLRHEKYEWALDVFNSHIADSNKAHIRSEHFPSLAKAIEFVCTEYKPQA